MTIQRICRPVLASWAAVVVAGCGGLSTEVGGTPVAAPTPSPAVTTPATTTSPPEPVSFEGSWSGTTTAGDAVSFEVRGDEITSVTMPTMKCGVGVSPTIETGTQFKGTSFRVEGLPLPYQLFPKGGGQPTTVQDEITMKGRFTSATTAKGTVVLNVRTGQDVTDSCKASWTASRS